MNKLEFKTNGFEIYGKDGFAYVKTDIETDKGTTHYDKMLMKCNAEDKELLKAIEAFLYSKIEKESIE